MYEFHYETLFPKYGRLDKLAYTNTDHIPHPNARPVRGRSWKYQRVRHLELSGLPPLYSKKNEEVLGKMKDECAGQAPQEFVCLQAKVHLMLLPHNKAKFTAKGVSLKYILTHLQYVDYRRSLQNSQSTTAIPWPHSNPSSSCWKPCQWQNTAYPLWMIRDGLCRTLGCDHDRIKQLKALQFRRSNSACNLCNIIDNISSRTLSTLLNYRTRIDINCSWTCIVEIRVFK